ncbi:lysis system i-spanin subunit Rz [Salinicola sp. V024]|uniref:lysis system i-spanin subunit Rz n=1 Tax=Salinicola sp. V024 TaxID=3459609 RepID=UPI004043FDE6
MFIAKLLRFFGSHITAIIIAVLLSFNFLQAIQIYQLQDNVSELRQEKIEMQRDSLNQTIKIQDEYSEKIDEIYKKYNQQIEDIRTSKNRLIDDFNAQRLKLRSDIATANVSANELSRSAQSASQTQCRLSTKFVESLIREAARADTTTEQLNALIDAVEAL